MLAEQVDMAIEKVKVDKGNVMAEINKTMNGIEERLDDQTKAKLKRLIGQ